MSSGEIFESSYTFVVENGDIIKDVIKIRYLGNNEKSESIDRYINNTYISTTVTHFVNGYKDRHQIITKESEDNIIHSFTNYYVNGELQYSR
jgi:hypothetical protein